MQRLSGPLRRIIALAIVAGALSACGLIQGNNVLDPSFWASSPLNKNDEAEFGIAELAKGNYVTAEGHFQKALKANPHDLDALLGSALLYQHTGQVTKARQMYEAVLALHPDDSKQFVVWQSVSTKPISQIASVNLQLLDTGGTAAAMRAEDNGNNRNGVVPMSANVGGAAEPRPVMGRSTAGASSSMETSSTGADMSQSNVGNTDVSSVSGYQGAFANVVSRFATLRALRNQGLITEDEYKTRRNANIGALLPLTSPPSAAGLDRPVPSTDQIASRLRAISRALQMRAISVAQHAAERSMILDALLPAAPAVVENPGAPPTGLMQAADAVRRLEKLREDGYISSDEYARERQAIELAVRGPETPKKNMKKAESSGGNGANPTSLNGGSKPAMKGPQPAVHLASYRSVAHAERGWTQLHHAYGGLLGGLKHEVDKVHLGSKGIYYRLKAGPLKSMAAAKALCAKLKAKRQFCQPSLMGG